MNNRSCFFKILISLILLFLIGNITPFYLIHDLHPLISEDCRVAYNLVNPIYIDDADPNYNWSKTALENTWCSGSGTWSDPYTIEDIVVNGNSISNCIDIRNSFRFFTIQNCTLFNSSVGYDFAAINLENVNNSLLVENNCSYNNGQGIRIIRAYNNTLQGNFIQYNDWDGILMRISANNTIDNNTITNNDRGIRIDQWPAGGIGINNIISNNKVHNNSGTGMTISDNEYLKIINNSVYNNQAGISTFTLSVSKSIFRGNFIHSHAVDNEGLSISGNNCTVVNNTIWDNGVGISVGGSNHMIRNNYLHSNDDGIRISYTNNSIIKENLIKNCNNLNGITFRSNNINLTMTRNKLINAIFNLETASGELSTVVTQSVDDSNLVNGKPVYFYANKYELGSTNFTNPGQIILFNCTESTITNLNDIPGGITLAYSENNTIANNSIHSLKFGLWLSHSEYNYILNNQISMIDVQFLIPAIRNGVLLEWSSYCKIYKNEIFSYYFGISLYFESTNNTLSYNIIYLTTVGIVIRSSKNYLYQNKIHQNGAGIFISPTGIGSCDHNDVRNNIITDNDWYGILLDASSNNTFIGNHITYNNITGMYIASVSNENLMFNNIFEGNLQNAQDDATNNQWDNGVIGNYWDDYTGYDLNEDGIGDIPYNITGSAGSQDRFPLLIISPVIVIENPNPYELFGFTPPEINLTITCSSIDTIWYTLSNETFKSINYTYTGFIEQNAWNSIGNGSVTIHFYVNNTYGLIGNNEVKVRKDIISPQVSIFDPILGQPFSFNAPFFNISVIEPNLDSIWYTINSGNTNFTIIEQTGKINESAWDNLPDGDLLLTFYAKDSLGNLASTEVVIEKDTGSPIITILSPNIGDTFGTTAPTFEISMIEDDLASTWYTVEGIAGTFSFTGLTGSINQDAWTDAPEGEITITFFALDNAGNIGNESVSVIKSITSQPVIPGYHIFLLIGISSTISIIITKMKIKNIKFKS
ncbi:MAG: NosD domain-containing protein [Promethearchaeota archaeon]